MKKIILFAFVLMISSVPFAAAQGSKNMQPQELAEAKRAEMKKLDGLIGQWSGSGWIMHEKGIGNFRRNGNGAKKTRRAGTTRRGKF